MGGRRCVLWLTGAMAGLALGSFLLSASAQEPAQSGLPLEGHTISNTGESRVEGFLDMEAVDVAASTVVLLGTFTGTIVSEDGTIRLEEQGILNPLLRLEPADSCEALI